MYEIVDHLKLDEAGEPKVLESASTLDEALDAHARHTEQHVRAIIGVRGGAMTWAHSLVVAHLHYSGEKSGALTDEQAWAVYCLADGFGPGLDEFALAELNDGWDWSHVRDSSPRAWLRMAERIVEFTGETPVERAYRLREGCGGLDADGVKRLVELSRENEGENTAAAA
jgi:hypothetical protein